MHIKKRKKKEENLRVNKNLNFLYFSTEKHNVYNIYVAINVPSFFKKNNCAFFSLMYISIDTSSSFTLSLSLNEEDYL